MVLKIFAQKKKEIPKGLRYRIKISNATGTTKKKKNLNSGHRYAYKDGCNMNSGQGYAYKDGRNMNSGQGYAYKDGRNMKEKKVGEIIKEIAPLKPRCNENCKKKCSEKIIDQDREIFCKF